MADHFQLRLVDSSMIAPTVRHLAFERADGQPLAFQPGQFLQVHFHYDDGAATKRSYSVATVGDGSSPVTRIEDRDLQPGPFYRKARELYWQFAHATA